MAGLRPSFVMSTLFMATTIVCSLPQGAVAQTDAGGNTDAAGGAATGISTKRVTLNLDNADIRSALKLLFNSVGANYSIEGNVDGLVTVALNDVPFSTALESVLRAASMPLTYRQQGGVYNISVRQPDVVADTGPAMTDTNDSNSTPSKPKGVWRKIHLMYADTYDLAMAFGANYIQSRVSMMGSGLGGGYGNGFGGGYGGGMGGYGGGGMGGFGGGMGGFGGGFGNGGFGGGFGNGGFGGGFGGGGFGGGFNNNNLGGNRNTRF